MAVEERHLESSRARRAGDVHGAVEADLRLGEGPGLVGAQHVHAAQPLDRRQALDDHVPRRQAQRPAREGDRHDHGQQFGRESHRERDREQEGVEQRPVQGGVHQQHEEHHEGGEAHHQHAEGADAALEARGRRFARERARDLADLGRRSRASDAHRRGAAHHRGAHEQVVGRLFRALLRGALLDRERLAGEQRFVHVQAVGLDEPPVARDQRSRGRAAPRRRAPVASRAATRPSRRAMPWHGPARGA